MWTFCLVTNCYLMVPLITHTQFTHNMAASSICIKCSSWSLTTKPELFAAKNQSWRSTYMKCGQQVTRTNHENSARNNRQPIWIQINNFWEFQYNVPPALSHKQLNSFVYSNICFYVPNIAGTTSTEWRRSHTIISWMEADQTVGRFHWLSLNSEFCQVLWPGTNVISSSALWCVRMMFPENINYIAFSTGQHPKHISIICRRVQQWF